ncbi:serine/threonine-protein kinase B-raf-like isoform X2 [Varroa destructor]|uniref:non-specific serine/threonine protein kinase n=1 Tax=Varroa destructor TaxID=109461 RepID=A0A7M7JGR2_VARDE|nr:serine/threonine-protein kinase B-raf-like isoform X2 [Varroa destructor]
MASVVNGTPIPTNDDLVHGELKNIRNMIRLTQTNLEMLNQRFSGYQHPPSIYLQEYEYLTSRLDDFQSREQELLDALGDPSTGSSSTATAIGASVTSSIGTSSTGYSTASGGTGSSSSTASATALSSTSGANSAVMGSSSAFNGNQSPDDTNFAAALLEGGVANSIGGRGGATSGDGGAPRSPMRSVVRIELPNAQHTTVQVRPGQTVVEALAKAMKRRKLSPEMCLAYKADSGELVDWDTDMGALGGDAELSVRIRDKFPVTTSISHNYVRKTFFSLAFCECCRKLLFHGFRCQTCGYRFHPRCADSVPALCQPLRVDQQYYKHLLAMQDGVEPPPAHYKPFIEEASSPRAIPGGGAGRGGDPHEGAAGAPLTAQRERSTSAPNVSYNMVNQDFSADLSKYKSQVYSSPENSPPIAPRGLASAFATSTWSDTISSAFRGHHHSNSQHSSTSSRKPNNSNKHHSVHLNSPQQQQQQASSLHSSGLVPPRCSQVSSASPTRTQSAQGSPTSSHKTPRPRARSADESSKKAVNQKSTRESIEDWEILPEEILTGPRIGSGSFGTVYRGHWHGHVALKKLNVTNPTPAQLQAFKNEVSVLRKTRHVSIILFMGCVSRPQLTIVTQWCEGSSLYKHLHVLETKFEMLQVIDIARQTAQGMDYLHAKNIIHRDLKSNNIFLHDDLTVKIGDFGLATVKARWSGSSPFSQPTGSILWMAPEVIRMKDPAPYSFQSDVYAFGIVLYELETQQLPYSNINNKDQILFMVGNGFLKPDMAHVRKDAPKALVRLTEDCIKFCRDDRPLFRQILASLESLMRSLPKIHRSTSEPTLNRTHLQSEDFLFACASPKTPSQFGNQPSFTFFSATGNF